MKFRDRKTEAFWNGRRVRRFDGIRKPARRKLDILFAARDLATLAKVPGNWFEALKGDRAGQYSIRINDQWRICFQWEIDEAVAVEIVDYH